MHPAILALFTALCWSIGGFFEKQGLKLGGLSPVMGITVRTTVALMVLSVASFRYWPTLQSAGTRPLLYLILGGGVLAGSVGMLCFYAAIHAGQLGQVMPVAFGLTPLVGFLLGVMFLGEPLLATRITGVLLTCAGVVLITWK